MSGTLAYLSLSKHRKVVKNWWIHLLMIPSARCIIQKALKPFVLMLLDQLAAAEVRLAKGSVRVRSLRIVGHLCMTECLLPKWTVHTALFQSRHRPWHLLSLQLLPHYLLLLLLLVRVYFHVTLHWQFWLYLQHWKCVRQQCSQRLFFQVHDLTVLLSLSLVIVHTWNLFLTR